MPTILGTPHAANYAGRPARMSPEDFDIWRRWWPTVRTDALTLYFDVGLGFPDELPPTEDPNQLLGWIRNTQKRADVIALRPRTVDVIELRFNASLNAIGRLAGYVALLDDDNPFNRPIRGILVTNRRDSDVQRMTTQLGMFYEVA